MESGCVRVIPSHVDPSGAACTELRRKLERAGLSASASHQLLEQLAQEAARVAFESMGEEGREGEVGKGREVSAQKGSIEEGRGGEKRRGGEEKRSEKKGKARVEEVGHDEMAPVGAGEAAECVVSLEEASTTTTSPSHHSCHSALVHLTAHGVTGARYLHKVDARTAHLRASHPEKSHTHTNPVPSLLSLCTNTHPLPFHFVQCPHIHTDPPPAIYVLRHRTHTDNI